MVFSSVIFLFLYLPLVIGIYFILRKNWRNFFLLALSLLFYFWGENWLVLIMVTSTLIDYTCGLAIARALGRGRNGPIELLDQGGKRSWKQKLALVVSIMANLSILAFFKYFNFGMDNYNSMMGVLGLSSMQWQSVFKVTLPLGISFYTFQSMSYTIDVYLGNARATRHLLNFACFVTMFPQLVAGPIVRYRDIAKQLVDRVVTRDGFASGVRRFTIGLGKKVLLANTVAWPADQIFQLPSDQLTFGLAWLGVVCYSLQILTSRVIRTWRSVLAGCSVSVFWKTSFIHIFLVRSKSSGEDGTSPFPAGTGIIYIYLLAAAGAGRDGFTSTWCWSFFYAACGTGRRGTL